MQPKMRRIARALARGGVSVDRAGGVWTLQKHGAEARILLPDSLPLERKAVDQLLALASVRHPLGGRTCQCIATPDFHPGDGGIAIGSVVYTEGMVIPSAVGRDINCGMRLHVLDLSRDRFEAHRDRLVALLKGDYLLGTRDIVLHRDHLRATLHDGLAGLADVPIPFRGALANVDREQLWDELDRVYDQGGRPGDAAWLPDDLLDREWRRDPVLGTIGGGNHFVEILEVAEVMDTRTAYRWGVRPDQLAFMIHSGSRTVGKAIGDAWKRRTRAEWPRGVPMPDVLSIHAESPACAAYLEAENTAANFGWLNRFVLAETMRRRVREVFGDVASPLVFDLPHNLTERRGVGFVTRKGACPAHPGQPVIIPGSMGASSFLMEGQGNPHFLESASHGAGRAVTRFELGRRGSRFTDDHTLGLDGVTCITLKEERRIEEAPAAYKPIGPVIEAQVDARVVRPIARLEPLLTFKG
mgnify:CR=1 FL=1